MKPAVHSVMPPEYQDDCRPFLDAILSQVDLVAERDHGLTFVDVRGSQTITVDVTDCNHIPTRIIGATNVDNGLETIQVDCVASLLCVANSTSSGQFMRHATYHMEVEPSNAFLRRYRPGV